MTNSELRPVLNVPWISKKPKVEYPMNAQTYHDVVELIEPVPFHGISASKWKAEHLLHLKIVAELSADTFVRNMQRLREAEKQVRRMPTLLAALEALSLDEIHLPDSDILRLLESKKAMIAFNFYVGLREVTETPYPRKVPPAHDLCPRDHIDNSTDSGKGSSKDPKTSDSTVVMADTAEYTQGSRINRNPVEEFVITKATVSFIDWVIALAFFDALKSPDTKLEKICQATVTQLFYKVGTEMGSFGCKTDGGIFVLVMPQGQNNYLRDKSIDTLVDIEAKAKGTTVFLPQHAAELIAHMADRLIKLVRKKRRMTYKDLTVEERTVHLLCFNESNFRVIWTTFPPQYLKWLFGPIKSANKSSFDKKKVPDPKKPPKRSYLDIQISPELSLSTPEGRTQVAQIIVYFIMDMWKPKKKQ